MDVPGKTPILTLPLRRSGGHLPVPVRPLAELQNIQKHGQLMLPPADVATSTCCRITSPVTCVHASWPVRTVSNCKKAAMLTFKVIRDGAPGAL